MTPSVLTTLWTRVAVDYVSGAASEEALAAAMAAIKSVDPGEALMPILIALRRMYVGNTERNARLAALEEKIAILDASQSVLR